MLWWVLINIWLISSLCINYVIEAFVGMQSPVFILYPDWLEELHYATLWFMHLFNQVTRFYCDPTRVLKPGEPDFSEWKFVGVYGFLLCLVATLGLRLTGIGYAAAYGIPFVVCVVIPVLASWIYFPIWLMHYKSERISASRLIAMAASHPAVCRFMDQFPHAVTYVYNNRNRNDQAVCLWHARRERSDREPIGEDILLEAFVNMKTMQVIEGGIALTRYLYREDDEGTAVFTLPPPAIETLGAVNEKLDDFTLDKMEAAVPRFPLLGEYPLPLVVNKQVLLDDEDEV